MKSSVSLYIIGLSICVVVRTISVISGVLIVVITIISVTAGFTDLP